MANGNFSFEGVGVPVSTPLNDGAVDVPALRDLVEWLAEAGVDGFVPCGTNGEFASLTDEQRRLVVETVVDAAGDRPVIAGAADTSVGGTREQVAAVTAAGADAVLLPPPYFHTANDPSGVVDFFDGVVAGTDADVVLYDLPAYTNQRLEPDLVAELAEREQVVAVKDSGGEFGHILDLVEATPDGFDVLVGPSRLLGPAVDAGADGGVNGLANVAPRTLRSCYEAGLAGDAPGAVDRFHEDLGDLAALTGEHGYVPTVKAALAELGAIPSAEVRPPLVELDADARAAVADAVAHLPGA